MQSLLTQTGNSDIRAYFVWGAFLRSDNEEAARASTLRFQAPNSEYFWSPSASLGQELARVLRLASGRVAWDVYLLYRRGTFWEKSIPEPAYWQRQLDVLQGEEFNLLRLEGRIQEYLRAR